MSQQNTLSRVDADLAAGRVPLARQRLRGLVSSFPHDLTLRRRLAGVYRLYGDAAEAGRWMYLEEDRCPEETAAFEERYGSPARRMRALAWRGPEARAPPGWAEVGLAAGGAAPAAGGGGAGDWGDPANETEDADEEHGPDGDGWTVGGVLAGLGCLAGTVAFVAVWVTGVLALFS
ncbi:DUF6584 family protein [Streptomyces sp. NPDC059082]|uniref:DUF6584 family protein n=1 Tax=Streptomyces sp. NPDC059082 TaxID=3346720 RepID=UPI0036C3C1C8